MKSVGERIRQARNERGLSGEALARAVGYKNQSAIGNLENRAGGTGGNKITLIAQALGVPVSWLLEGPDTDKVPFLVGAQEEAGSYTRRIEAQRRSNISDPWILEAITILGSLSEPERAAAVARLREFVQNLGPPRDGQTLSMAA